MGLGHPAHPQMGHEAHPHHCSPPCCLQLPPCRPQDGVLEMSPPHIKHPALGSQGGIWELLSLEETASPEERAVGWLLQTHLWQDPHWGHRGSSYHSPGCEPGRENTSQLPKGLHPSLGATAIISTAHALPRGWHWEPASHTHPSGTLLSVHGHLCAKVALKGSCVC